MNQNASQPETAPAPEAVIIVGVGLLGGSIGLGLRAAGYAGRRIGIARTQATLDTARQRGCVDETATDLADVLRRMDERAAPLVVLATPLGRFADLLATLAADSHGNLVVTDVGSTKARVCQDARRLLPRPGWFVGSHPMAGSEKQGPAHAAADLFRGRPCILTPADDAQPRAMEVVTWLWRTLGMRLLTMEPAEHDRQVAAISHLPHAAAVALVQLAVETGALEVASTGFRDTTRIAAGDVQVWADIFECNREAVADALGRYGELLDHLRAVVAHGSREDLVSLLGDVRTARSDWARQAGLQTEGDGATE